MFDSSLLLPSSLVKRGICKSPTAFLTGMILVRLS